MVILIKITSCIKIDKGEDPPCALQKKAPHGAVHLPMSATSSI